MSPLPYSGGRTRDLESGGVDYRVENQSGEPRNADLYQQRKARMGGQPTPRHVAIAIAIQLDTTKKEKDQVFVCLVSSRKHKNQWVLPKGGVEKGESERAAALRELEEEGTSVV